MDENERNAYHMTKIMAKANSWPLCVRRALLRQAPCRVQRKPLKKCMQWTYKHQQDLHGKIRFSEDCLHNIMEKLKEKTLKPRRMTHKGWTRLRQTTSVLFETVLQSHLTNRAIPFLLWILLPTLKSLFMAFASAFKKPWAPTREKHKDPTEPFPVQVIVLHYFRGNGDFVTSAHSHSLSVELQPSDFSDNLNRLREDSVFADNDSLMEGWKGGLKGRCKNL